MPETSISKEVIQPIHLDEEEKKLQANVAQNLTSATTNPTLPSQVTPGFQQVPTMDQTENLTKFSQDSGFETKKDTPTSYSDEPNMWRKIKQKLGLHWKGETKAKKVLKIKTEWAGMHNQVPANISASNDKQKAA